MNPSSAELTVACLTWLRFGKQFSYVATEYATWAGRRADVFGCDEKESIEIEVKVSLSDLRRDFEAKGWKHQRYQDGHPDQYRNRMPQRVYFAVPERLRDETLKLLAVEAPAYGVIVMIEDDRNYYHEIPWKKLRVAKSAKWMHREAPSKSLIADMTHRMASEVALFHITALRWGQMFHHLRNEIERHHQQRPLIAADVEDLLPKENLS